jgi:hypothetical protein
MRLFRNAGQIFSVPRISIPYFKLPAPIFSGTLFLRKGQPAPLRGSAHLLHFLKTFPYFQIHADSSFSFLFGNIYLHIIIFNHRSYRYLIISHHFYFYLILFKLQHVIFLYDNAYDAVINSASRFIALAKGSKGNIPITHGYFVINLRGDLLIINYNRTVRGCSFRIADQINKVVSDFANPTLEVFLYFSFAPDLIRTVYPLIKIT